MSSRHNQARVFSGLDVLMRDGHPELTNKRIGLVTNHTAVTKDVVSIIDAMHADDRFTLVRLFGPEHGVRGSAQAGDHVTDELDAATGLEMVSLYGPNRAPTAEQLADLDAIVYDLQDAGARHYTYMGTLVATMEACAPTNVPVVVLDRPNPITGLHAEGKILEPAFKSFVGIHPMPTRHSLTIGELSLLFAADLNLPQPIVIACEGWTRDMWWDDTDLPFVFPSPNLPSLESLMAYTATCPLEATPLSEGRGTTKPFELFGAPWVDANALVDDLNARNLPGVRFRPTWFTPWISKHPGELCAGAQIHITDRDAFAPVSTGIHILHALMHVPGSEFSWREGAVAGMSHGRLYGNTELHDLLNAGESAEHVISTWQPELDEWVERAKAFHLYQ